MTLVRTALGLVFLAIVIKAAGADITWDESWSFLHYGRAPGGFLAFDYANDQVLNSVAIWASTATAGPSVFAIRLPNVLAGGVYLATTARLVRSVRSRGAALGLAAFNPYLVEHFALARGYGLAVALLFAGLVADSVAPARAGRHPDRYALAGAVGASYAIASDVAIVAGLVAARLLVAGRSGGRRAIGELLPGSLLACLAALPALAIGLHETRHGVPVFGGTDGPFDALAGGFARMWVARRDGPALAAVLVVLAAASAIAAVRHRRRLSDRSRLLGLAIAIALVLVAAASVGLDRPWPTDRLLVPSLPLWNLAVVSLLDDARAARPVPARIASAAILLVCGIAFLARFHATRFIDWAPDAGLEARTARAVAARRDCLPRDVWARYGHEYYLFRWFGADGRGAPPDRPCPGG